MKTIATFLKTDTYGFAPDAGLLILRVGAGLMMLTHGWPKLIQYSEKAEGFYNFIGLGGPVTLALTVFGEFFCSIFLVLGLGTRLILIPLIILAFVIAFVVHGPDPFGDKEHALLFMVPYVTLMLTGPGKFSVDFLLFNKAVVNPIMKSQ